MADDASVLVVGGGHAEIPLINAARALGYRVITTGNRPSDLGHAHADLYAPADFSKPEEILDVAVAHDVSAIVSGCNDFAMLSTALVCEKLGLPGHDSYETTVRIHHKDRFRELLEELHLDTPKSGVVHDATQAMTLCEKIGYPVIVKPVDLTGGKGISVCDSPQQLSKAVDDALALSRQDYVVVEQFLTGTRHGFTCFVTGRRVGFWFADDEQYFLNPFLVSGTTTPTSMPQWALDELVGAVGTIASKLELVDGLVHVQCIMTEAGPRIIEVCRRCPGDLYPVFVELSTDFAYADAVVRNECGLDGAAPLDGHPQRCITRHCIMPAAEGVLRYVEFDQEVRTRVVDEMVWWSPGQLVENHLTQKFGIIFLGFGSSDEMHDLTRQLGSRVIVDMV